VELRGDARAQDARERPRQRQQRRDRDQDRGQRSQVAEARLDRETGERAQRPRGQQHAHRLARDAPEQPELRAQRHREGHERGNATDDGEHAYRGIADVQDQQRSNVEARQRHHVAGRGHHRDGHVVDVPLAPRAECCDTHRDRHHDCGRDQSTEHRHDHEVPDTDRAADGEGLRDALGDEREEHGEAERQRGRREEVLADLGVGAAREPERAGCDCRAEAAAQRAEDVAAQADGRRDEDEQTGKLLERPGDGAEDQAGCKPRRRGEQVRDKARSHTGRIRADERAEPPHEAEAARHCQ
jgi:hypothetical protein